MLRLTPGRVLRVFFASGEKDEGNETRLSSAEPNLGGLFRLLLSRWSGEEEREARAKMKLKGGTNEKVKGWDKEREMVMEVEER